MHSTKPERVYNRRAGLKASIDPVSRLTRSYLRCLASASMWSSRPAATPLRKCLVAVRMDFISPCFAFSSLRAPQPIREALCQTVQKVISGRRKAARSSAWILSGGECNAMSSRCCCSNARISSPLRSSFLISI